MSEQPESGDPPMEALQNIMDKQRDCISLVTDLFERARLNQTAPDHTLNGLETALITSMESSVDTLNALSIQMENLMTISHSSDGCTTLSQSYLSGLLSSTDRSQIYLGRFTFVYLGYRPIPQVFFRSDRISLGLKLSPSFCPRVLLSTFLRYPVYEKHHNHGFLESHFYLSY